VQWLKQADHLMILWRLLKELLIVWVSNWCTPEHLYTDPLVPEPLPDIWKQRDITYSYLLVGPNSLLLI